MRAEGKDDQPLVRLGEEEKRWRGKNEKERSRAMRGESQHEPNMAKQTWRELVATIRTSFLFVARPILADSQTPGRRMRVIGHPRQGRANKMRDNAMTEAGNGRHAHVRSFRFLTCPSGLLTITFF